MLTACAVFAVSTSRRLLPACWPHVYVLQVNMLLLGNSVYWMHVFYTVNFAGLLYVLWALYEYVAVFPIFSKTLCLLSKTPDSRCKEDPAPCNWFVHYKGCLFLFWDKLYPSKNLHF
jgi:hypothetical protein